MFDAVTRLNDALQGRYRIERELGEGGMATVYLAHDERHDRRVALKVLKPELAAVVGAERFLAEISTTARLQHPNILPLFDSGEAGGFLFYVMPYVEGESLRERLDREKQLPLEEAVRLATEAAEALQAAHEEGIVHRDIKPANILLSRGRPLVADFGIALAVSQAGGDRLTETGLSVGTPYYMSPEQATGDPGVGPASDVYALGCVVYEMLVGEPPYTGATAQAVLGKILLGSPARPTEFRSTIPPQVEGAVLKALQRLPADRFGGAADFARALADPAFRYGPGPVASTADEPKWGGRVLVGGLSATTLLLLALALWGWLRPTPEPVVRFELPLPGSLDLVTRNGVNLDVSPDGSRVVFTATGPDGVVGLWQRSLDRLDPSHVPGTENARNPRVSPDGGSVAFTSEGRLRSVSLAGSPPITLVDDSVPDGGGGLAWGDDGTIYFRKRGLGIWRVSPGGDDEREVTTLDATESGHVWLDALPGGRGLLFTRSLGGPTENEIAVHDLRSGETRSLVQGAMARYAASGHLVYTSGEGSLLAAPFDVDDLEVAGPTRALLEGVEVLTGSASYFALSRTGVLLYRPGAGQADWTPVWVAPDGSEEVLDPELGGDLFQPTLSPDGRKVALTYTPPGGAQDIWIYDLDQRTFSRLTFEGRNGGPSWSPDGREVAFDSDRDGEAPALYARRWDLSSDTRLLLADTEPGVPLHEPVWTPDGRGLVYRRGDGPDTDLYYSALDPDSAAVPVLDDGFRLDSHILSLDGRWLAYVSDATGARSVYVRPFPGPGGSSPVSPGGGTAPVWVDDDEIVYEAADDSWVSATVRTEPDFSVESRSAVAPRAIYVGDEGTLKRNFDVSRADGRILAIRRTARTEEDRDVVVLGWFRELRER